MNMSGIALKKLMKQPGDNIPFRQSAEGSVAQ